MTGERPPNNRLKLPMFVVFATAGLVFAACGALVSDWGFAIYGAVLFVLCIPPILVTRQGRNPSWLQSPMDRRLQRRRSRR
jgi:hypothetical protein